MNRTGLLIVAGLLLTACGLTAVWAEEPADEVRLLRAQNGLLKATIEARDKKIAELQEELKKLKTEPAQAELESLRESLKVAKERIAELEGKLAKVTPEPEVKHLTLAQLLNAAREYSATPERETQAAREMRQTAIRKRFEKRRFEVEATLHDVVQQKGEKGLYIAKVAYVSRRQVRYKTTVGAGGFYGGRTVTRSAPAESVTVHVTIASQPAVTWPRETTVNVVATCDEIEFAGTPQRGLQVTIRASGGQVTKPGRR